ncbi:MAG: hypothetical protein ACOX0K_07360 [Oscillospiraceae bacterium]
MTNRICTACSAELEPQAKFCPDCGARSPALEAPPAPAAAPAAVAVAPPPPPATAPTPVAAPPTPAAAPAAVAVAPPPPPPAAAPTPMATPPAPAAAPAPVAVATPPPPAAAAPPAPDTAKPAQNNTYLGVFGYVITMLALSLPVIGIVLAFVWAFGAKTNLARKNFCRGVLILSGLFLILAIIGFVANYSALMALIQLLLE